jgi:hypothetical protein
LRLAAKLPPTTLGGPSPTHATPSSPSPEVGERLRSWPIPPGERGGVPHPTGIAPSATCTDPELPTQAAAPSPIPIPPRRGSCPSSPLPSSPVPTPLPASAPAPTSAAPRRCCSHHGWRAWPGPDVERGEPQPTTVASPNRRAQGGEIGRPLPSRCSLCRED